MGDSTLTCGTILQRNSIWNMIILVLSFITLVIFIGCFVYNHMGSPSSDPSASADDRKKKIIQILMLSGIVSTFLLVASTFVRLYLTRNIVQVCQ